MRFVLDTNVVISSYLNALGSSGRTRTAFEKRRFELAVSDALLAEYEKVLNYPRVATLPAMSVMEVTAQIAGLRESAIVVPLAKIPNLIPEDPPDNDVVATAVSGEAAYIVSGDDDLHRLGGYEGIRVVTPALFLKLLSQ